MEKTAKQGDNLPFSFTEVFGLLNSRIHEQSKKIDELEGTIFQLGSKPVSDECIELIETQSKRIGLLLEIIHYQNKAIKSSKAIDSGLMENASAADICIADLLADCLSKEEADTEAA